MLHRIRDALAHTRAERFVAPVEAYETYVGGKARNIHARRRSQVRPSRDPDERTP